MVGDQKRFYQETRCPFKPSTARNLASQRVLEKAGLKKEGTMRKYVFSEENSETLVCNSIRGEEWKEPGILTETT